MSKVVSTEVKHISELKPLRFLSSRSFGFRIAYKVSRKTVESATVVCRSDDDCELSIRYYMINGMTKRPELWEMIIKGSQDELAPLIYLIESLVATESFYY